MKGKRTMLHHVAIGSTVALLLWLSGVSPLACKRRPDSASPERPLTLPQVDTALPKTEMQLAGEAFTIELAFRRADRRQGLMGRTRLGPNEGMLFVFRHQRERSFYMKNCLIDLDILFLRSDGEIVRVTTMRAPQPGEPLVYYRSGAPAKYALELAAGTAARLGLQAGDVVTLPERALRVLPDPD